MTHRIFSILAGWYHAISHRQSHHYFIRQRVNFWAAKESPSRENADPWLPSREDSDAEAPLESQDDGIPFFDDEDSAAWASFSSNVAIASKSLSSIPVRDFNLHIAHSSSMSFSRVANVIQEYNLIYLCGSLLDGASFLARKESVSYLGPTHLCR